jgi:hypothetical protein
MPPMCLSSFPTESPDGADSIDIAELSFRYTMCVDYTAVRALLRFHEVEHGTVLSHVIDVPLHDGGTELDPIDEAEAHLDDSGLVVVGPWYRRPGLNAVWARIGYVLPRP